ncbi:MAG: hypothetical protein WC319_12145 [Candidatus Paceibacterota bacterium]|jgi:hypothetical protein
MKKLIVLVLVLNLALLASCSSNPKYYEQMTLIPNLVELELKNGIDRSEKVYVEYMYHTVVLNQALYYSEETEIYYLCTDRRTSVQTDHCVIPTQENLKQIFEGE